MTSAVLPFTFVNGPGNVIDATQVNADLVALRDVINGNLDAGNMAASAKPVTLLGQYRTLADAHAHFDDGDTSGAKLFAEEAGLVASGTSVNLGVGGQTTRKLLAFDPADYAVSGLTVKFRVRASVATNATGPAITFTFGLYPVTSAGAADNHSLTLGTVTSGSTVAIASPSASSVSTSAGSDFTPPSSGVYALGVALSGTVAASSCGLLMAQLDVRHV